MDTLVTAIAQILHYVKAYDFGAIMQLRVILEPAMMGMGDDGTLAVLFAKEPALKEITTHSLALLNSGAGATEIATEIFKLATDEGVPIRLIMLLLKIIMLILQNYQSLQTIATGLLAF